MFGDVVEVYVAYKDGDYEKAAVKGMTTVLNYVGGKLMEKEFGEAVLDKVPSELLDYGTGVMSDAMSEKTPTSNTTGTKNAGGSVKTASTTNTTDKKNIKTD